MEYIFWGVWAVCLVAMLVYYGKRKHPLMSAIGSMVCGVSALLVCHYFGQSIGFTPQVNLFNTMLSLTLGVPSIVLMYISNFV